MVRATAVVLILAATGLLSFSSAEAILGMSVKVGWAFIPEGHIPGAVLQADLGPFSPFAEVYKKSGLTTVNLGASLLLIKLPFPIAKPYIGIGGGLSRSSGGGVSKERVMASAVAGTDLKLRGNTGLFGQVKYFYTFGSGAFVIRKVAFQAGLAFGLGL